MLNVLGLLIINAYMVLHTKGIICLSVLDIVMMYRQIAVDAYADAFMRRRNEIPVEILACVFRYCIDWLLLDLDGDEMRQNTDHTKFLKWVSAPLGWWLQGKFRRKLVHVWQGKDGWWRGCEIMEEGEEPMQPEDPFSTLEAAMDYYQKRFTK